MITPYQPVLVLGYILVIDVGVQHALVVFIYVKVCISRRRSQFYDNIKCLVLLSAGWAEELLVEGDFDVRGSDIL